MENSIYSPTFSILEYCTELSKLDKSGKMIEFGNSVITVTPSGFYSRCFLDVMAKNPKCISPDEVRADVATAKSYGVRTISYTEELMPENTGELLNDAGFVEFITQTGMVFGKDSPFEECNDPCIVEIGKERMDEWQDTLVEAFAPEKPREIGVFELLATHPKIKFYAYEEYGKIIGTSVLHMNGSNSGIHEVSVLPEARRKGIASKLVRKMLTDMKGNNLYGASLQASEMGFFVYEKIGFKTLSKIHTFVLQ